MERSRVEPPALGELDESRLRTSSGGPFVYYPTAIFGTWTKVPVSEGWRFGKSNGAEHDRGTQIIEPLTEHDDIALDVVSSDGHEVEATSSSRFPVEELMGIGSLTRRARHAGAAHRQR
jgi:hypothetical protein